MNPANPDGALTADVAAAATTDDLPPVGNGGEMPVQKNGERVRDHERAGGVGGLAFLGVPSSRA